MSHATGKIEAVALTNKHVIFKYHRSADPDLSGRVFVFKRDRAARWFDDYTELVEDFALSNPYGSAISTPDDERDILDSVG
jgi:hypothetical protein